MSNTEEKINMVELFTNAYDTKKWGDDNIIEYNGSSGFGSEVDYNYEYILFLKKFITDNQVNVVIDLGCGNFKYGVELYKDLNVMYNGFDVYSKLIDYHNLNTKKISYYWSFNYLDFFNDRDKIPYGDLCIIKDVFQHWDYDLTYDFLDYLIKTNKFKYILICNCANQTEDKQHIGTSIFRPISNEYYPLKMFNLTEVFAYKTKKVYLYCQNQ